MIVADLSFAANEYEKLCSRRREAQKKYGPDGAKRLMLRVKELQSTADVAILKQGPGKWHDVHHDWPGGIAGTVTGGSRIVVKPHEGENGLRVWHVVCLGDCYDH